MLAERPDGQKKKLGCGHHPLALVRFSRPLQNPRETACPTPGAPRLPIRGCEPRVCAALGRMGEL